MSHTETHSFQAEVQQLLQLTIHSLYSNKEIFVRELISNASDALDKLRFAEVTSHELTPSEKEKGIRISCLKESRRLVIEDNGIGFDARYAERIFQPFQRLHGRSAYEGTGIGLAIARRVVDRHHGTIEARSHPGEGTTFTVRLPLVPPDVPETAPELDRRWESRSQLR